MAKSIHSARVTGGSAGAVAVESVADILERDLDDVIQEWLIRVDKEPELTAIPLNFMDGRRQSEDFFRLFLVPGVHRRWHQHRQRARVRACLSPVRNQTDVR
jgi:hypothetical protein